MYSAERYYRMFLKNFIFDLRIKENEEMVARMFEENDIETLEKFVLEAKPKMTPERFFYYAGHTAGVMDPDLDENADLNAGKSRFEKLIGLPDAGNI